MAKEKTTGHTIEALGTGAIMLFEGEEIEIMWNFGTMAIDRASKIILMKNNQNI